MITNKKMNQEGFSLIELTIAMAMGLILLTGVYSVFSNQEKAYRVQDQLTEMLQSNRVGVDFMTRDIRMAGYDITESGIFGFTDSNYSNQATATSVATAQEIYFTVDDNEDGVLDNNTNEKKGYRIVDTSGDGNFDTLQIDMLGSGWQPFIENVVALSFVYTYADGELSSGAAGLPDNTDVDNTNDFADVRSVQISMTARSEKEDSKYTTGFNLTGTVADGTCRTKVMTTETKPRNIGL